MDTTITVFQVLIGILFTGGALLKLALPYARFANIRGVSWSKDFKPGHVHLIAVVELMGSLGLLVPLLVPSLAPLTPLAAVGIALYMGGAMATHLRRSEYPHIAVNLVWLGLALFIAYGRLVGFAV